MITEINGYKSLLMRISIAQNVQFHKEAATGITPFAAKINGIAPAFGTYQADANKLDNEFETLYLARTDAKSVKRERGTLKELTAKANHSFDIICQIINGLSLMSLDADTKAALDEIIRFIDGQIHQYTTVYSRHAGVVASKKGKDGETTDVAGENENGEG
jgi:hypothetical protein